MSLYSRISTQEAQVLQTSAFKNRAGLVESKRQKVCSSKNVTLYKLVKSLVVSALNPKRIVQGNSHIVLGCSHSSRKEAKDLFFMRGRSFYLSEISFSISLYHDRET